MNYEEIVEKKIKWLDAKSEEDNLSATERRQWIKLLFYALQVMAQLKNTIELEKIKKKVEELEKMKVYR